MARCVICNCEVSNNPFSTKDKYELLNHSYICKTCAHRIGITSIWSAATYTAEKAKEKYYQWYPTQTHMRKGLKDLDNEYILQLCQSGKRLDAIKYTTETAAIGYNEAVRHVDSLIASEDDAFITKIKAIPNCDTTWTKKELKYLRSILSENEEVLHVVSGIMEQEDVSISGNKREIGAKNTEMTQTWLMALTSKRILMINRHLLIGTECIDIPLEMVNSISYQTRMLFSSISIMRGSSGVFINQILKGCEKPFVDKANQAIKTVRNGSTAQIVNAINNTSTKTSLSVADELIKLKSLLDQNVITQEEFDSQKRKLLS